MRTIPIDYMAKLPRIQTGVVRKPMNKWAPLVWAGCLVFSGAVWFAVIEGVCHLIWAVCK